MSDLTANVVVANALQLFTASRSFKALANGRIYVGEPDTDPTIPSNQKAVFIHNESGSSVQIPQPIVINAGGHAVYGGQLILKLTTEGNYSMAIYDAYGAQEYYFDNMARYDSDVLLSMLSGPDGAGIIGYGNSDVENTLYHTPEEFYTTSMDTAFTSSFAATASDGRTTWVKGNKSLLSVNTIPENVKILNDGKITSAETTNLPAFWMNNNTSFIGGEISNSGRAQALRSEGKTGFFIKDVKATGTYVTNDSLPAFAFDFYTSTDVYLSNLKATGYTGGLSLTQTRRATATGMNFRDMKYHPALVAGAYGVLLQGTRDTIISDVYYKAGTDGYGRHGLYVSQTGGNTCLNTVFKGAVFDYTEQPDATSPPGAINIRANDRAIYNSVIIDGSRITGTTENGNINAQVISNNIIGSFKHGTSIAYGITLGDDTGSNRVRNSLVSSNIITIAQRPGASSDFMYAIVVSGQDNSYIGNFTRIPDQGQPYLVRANATNCLIQGAMDAGPAQGQGLPFLQFDGVATNISVKGCKTNRPWFRTGNLSGVTDLTVDWPRSCAVAVNGGTPSYDDQNELIASAAVGTQNIIVTFNTHVTTAALAAATVTSRKTTTPTFPVITARSGKTLTIEFYNTSGTQINPTTTACAATITLFS